MPMFGLPETTAINKPLYKKALFEKFNMKEPDSFNADISRMVLVARVATSTVPALKEGKEINGFYVLQVFLKRKNYDIRHFFLLHKLIPQDIVYALQYEDETQFLAFHTCITVHSEWVPTSDATITLKGMTMDDAWRNLVADIGHLDAQSDISLEDQMLERENREAVLHHIASLEKQCRLEKQTRKKYELHQQIIKLKEGLK